MNKDAAQKDLLYRHFRAQDWYAVPEVPVFNGRGYERKPKLVTDVDVLGIRPSGDLTWEFVLGDCKTKRNESPANRVLWVHGLMTQFNATRAFILLRQENGIERDHMLFGDAHGVTLLEERVFETFDRCVIHPGGSRQFPESMDDLRHIRERIPAQYPTLRPLAEYINRDAWNESDLVTMMRKCLGASRGVRREVDPARTDHLAFILEAASVFSVGVAACVGTIFHQYLLTNDASELDEGLKVLIWGGRENYEHLSSLRRQYLEAKGTTTDEGGLALPEWQQFLHVIRSFLAAPKLAFRMPQLLRSVAIALVTNNEAPLSAYGVRDLMLIKLSMNATAYFAASSGFPPDTIPRIKTLFHKRMAELTVGSSSSAPTGAAPVVQAESDHQQEAAGPDKSGQTREKKEERRKK